MSRSKLKVLVLARGANAASVAGALQRRGHHVLVADRCTEALHAIPADVVVFERELEGGAGFDLLESWRERGLCPRAVALSERPDAADFRRALRLPIDEWIPVPFALEELLAAVEADRVCAPARRCSRPVPLGPQPHGGVVRELLGFALLGGVQPSTRARIGTATAEVVDNACRHAYPGLCGPVAVEAHRCGAEIRVSVSDEGVGVDPADLALGPMLDAPRCGLARAAALCEDLRLLRNTPRGTRIELRFGTYPTTFEVDALVDLSEHDFLTPTLVRRILRAAEGASDDDLVNLPPALAVTVGRLLAGIPSTHNLTAALWS